MSVDDGLLPVSMWVDTGSDLDAAEPLLEVLAYLGRECVRPRVHAPTGVGACAGGRYPAEQVHDGPAHRFSAQIPQRAFDCRERSDGQARAPPVADMIQAVARQA